jgi:ATP-dependent Clp protease protease subunit
MNTTVRRRHTRKRRRKQSTDSSSGEEDDTGSDESENDSDDSDDSDTPSRSKRTCGRKEDDDDVVLKHTKTNITTTHNVIRFFADVTTETALTFIRHLDRLCRRFMTKDISATDGIVIHVNSPGGEVSAGMVIADAMLACSVPITTRIVGSCASAGTFIAFAADKECTMSRWATLMVHQPSGGVVGTARDIEVESNNMQTVYNLIKNFYKQQCPALDHVAVNRLLKVDEELTAERALSLGLIDRIV